MSIDNQVPMLWPGETVLIVGGGPSVNAIKPSVLEDAMEAFHVIGVNNAIAMPNVDALWFNDFRWYQWHEKEVYDFEGPKYTIAPHVPAWSGVKRLKKAQERNGIDLRPTHVCSNNHSGGAAVNFAIHLGARRIVLVGFDMRPGSWHGDPRHKADKDIFRVYRESYSRIAKQAGNIGVTIMNASKMSSLHQFEKIDLADLLKPKPTPVMDEFEIAEVSG